MFYASLKDCPIWITYFRFLALMNAFKKQATNTFTAFEEFGTSAHGNEGIILFSKVKCDKVTYGTGHGYASQSVNSRVSDCIMVFTTHMGDLANSHKVIVRNGKLN